MIYCPYCLYKNSAGATICANCKNNLPVETPSRKLLSYSSQPADPGTSTPNTGQPVISQPVPVFQPHAPRANRLYSPTSETASQTPVPQINQMYAPQQEPMYQPPVSQANQNQMYAPPQAPVYQPPVSQANQIFAPQQEPFYQSPVSQANQTYVPQQEPTFQPPAPPANQVYAPVPTPPTSQLPIVQMGTVSSQMMISTRRAFAGYGIFLRHRSFVLQRKDVRADNVLQTIGDVLSKRNPSFQLSGKHLCERGFQPEERFYLVLRRRVSTVFIYVAPAGDDLYISRSTSVHCSISFGRVLAMLLMILAVCLPFWILPVVAVTVTHNATSVYSTATSSSNTSGASGSSSSNTSGVYGGATATPGRTSSGPGSTTATRSSAASSTNSANASAALGIALLFGSLISLASTISFFVLIWYLIRSCIYWLREKDFLVYLRSLFLKDFEMDDIMLLEHVTDMTIRMAVATIGLDANQIKPPEEGYKQDRRVRLL